MEKFEQPKIAGYRQLTPEDAALINEAKAIAEQCGAFIERLRAMPATGKDGRPIVVDGQPSIDQRWVSIGATHLQEGWMAVVRGIAQPTTF